MRWGPEKVQRKYETTTRLTKNSGITGGITRGSKTQKFKAINISQTYKNNVYLYTHMLEVKKMLYFEF